MNFNDQAKKPNLLSLSIIVLAHIVVFSLIISSINGRFVLSPPPVIHIAPKFDLPPPKREELPPPPKPKFKQLPPPIFVPKVEPDVIPPPNAPTIATTDVPPEKLPPTHPTVVVEDKFPEALPHKPVRSAAVVDAKNCEKPEYPRNALRNGDSGLVRLALLIGIDGRVKDSKIEKSSGFRELDQAAQVGLSLCKFKPAQVDGVPEQAWAKMEYMWTMD